MRNKYKKLLRLVISLSLLSYFFYLFVDINSFLDTLKNINIFYYLIGYSFGLLGMLFSVIRWKKILDFNGQSVGFLRLLKLYFIGCFYNLILPGMISGDVVRAYKTSRNKGDKIKLFTSVPLERITGLISLLLVMLFSIIVLHDYLSSTLIIELLIVVIILFTGLLIIINKNFERFILKILDICFLRRFDLKEKLQRFFESFQTLKDKKVLLQCIFLSLLFIFSSFFPTYFIAKSIGAYIPYLFIVGVNPIIMVIIIIPISFGGLGVREGLYIYFFSFIGIAPEISVAIGLIGFTMLIINAIIGGVLNIFR